MAIQDFGHVYIPGLAPGPSSVNTTPNFDTSQFVLDAAGEQMAMIVRAPKAGTISKVAFRTATVSVSGDADVRLETVSATTGDPTGTLFGTNTNGTTTLNASNTWFTTTLTAGAVVAKGDILAAVIARSTGTYTMAAMVSGVYRASFPYTDHFTGAWVKFSQCPVLAFEYSGGTYAPILGAMPFTAMTNQAFNSSTAGADERGIKFRLPLSVRVIGAWAQVESDADFTIKLYDSDGSTVLTSRAVDTDQRFGTNHGIRYEEFDTSVTLLANTFYRLTLLPTTTTNITSHELTTPSAAVMAALPYGTEIHLTTRLDAGAWTDTTTQRVMMGIVADGIDSGGGGPVNLWSPVTGRGRLVS